MKFTTRSSSNDVNSTGGCSSTKLETISEAFRISDKKNGGISGGSQHTATTSSYYDSSTEHGGASGEQSIHSFADSIERARQDDKATDLTIIPTVCAFSTSSGSKTNIRIREIAIQKLNFTRLTDLYGRDNESDILKQTWNQVSSSSVTDDNNYDDNNVNNKNNIGSSRCCSCDRSFIFIEGKSGTGKSALVTQSLEKYVRRSGGFFVRGKFDLQQIQEPLSAIKHAIKQLIDEILVGFHREKQQQQQQQKEGNSTISLSCCPSSSSSKLVMKHMIQKIVRELESEMTLLTRVIPNLGSLFKVDIGEAENDMLADPRTVANTTTTKTTTTVEDDDEEEGEDKGEDDFKGAGDTFNFALRKFLQIVTTFVPVTIFCDDLQWSDIESVNLLKAWLTDVEAKRLLVVGCYRTNDKKKAAIVTTAVVEDTTHQYVSQMVEEIEACGKERSVMVQRLTIDGISPESINTLLHDLLNTDPSETQELARIVAKKTGGNPLALKQFLLYLAKEELLNFNLVSTKWVWNDEDIRLKSITTENVVNVMMSRLMDIPMATKVLPIAACIGATFSIETLRVVQRGLLNINNDKNAASIMSEGSDCFETSSEFLNTTFTDVSSDLKEEIQVCLDEGFIEDLGNGTYSFVHDKVQEAALSLISNINTVKFRIGEILWRDAATSDNGSNSNSKAAIENMLGNDIFAIVGLLSNRLDLIHVDDDETNKESVARLNFIAGKKAMAIPAFRSAALYFRVAIDLLPDNIWKVDRKFCLDLYSSSAEAEYCIGNFDQMKVSANTIIPQNCDPVEKLRVCYVVLDAYTAIEEHDVALNLGIQILSQLGCRIPTSTAGVLVKTISGLVSTKMAAKKINQDIIDKIPVTNDPVHVGIMKMLDAFMYPCYSEKPELLPLICIEMYRHTFKNGITPWAPVSFSFLGFIFMHYLGDLEGGKKFAEYAFDLMKKYKFCKSVEPKTLFMIHTGVWHWLNPLQIVMKNYIDCYDMGMKVGDCETALISIYYYLEACLYTGRDVVSIQTDLCTYMKQMVDYKQGKALGFSKFLLQSLYNLCGKSGNTSTLTGSVVDQEECLKLYAERKDAQMIAHIHRRRLFLACYFAEYDLGAEVALKEGDKTMQGLISQISVPVIAFAGSLCCYVKARKTGRRVYQRHAKKYHRLIKNWSAQNPNCVHFLIILNAEKALLKGKIKDAIALYENAILTTGRSGLIHDQALANERLAELHMEQNMMSQCKFRLLRSMALFSEWKAIAKVRQLRKRINGFECSEMFTVPESNLESSMRGVGVL